MMPEENPFISGLEIVPIAKALRGRGAPVVQQHDFCRDELSVEPEANQKYANRSGKTCDCRPEDVKNALLHELRNGYVEIQEPKYSTECESGQRQASSCDLQMFQVFFDRGKIERNLKVPRRAG